MLAQATGFDRPYGSNPYQRYDAADGRPLRFNGRSDGRLPAMERVAVVTVGDDTAVVPFGTLARRHVVQATVGGAPVAVFHKRGVVSALDGRSIPDPRDVGTAAAFDRRLAGRTLDFTARGDGTFADRQTGSVWDVTGQAVAGPLRGARLVALRHDQPFWFAVGAFHPRARILRATGRGRRARRRGGTAATAPRSNRRWTGPDYRLLAKLVVVTVPLGIVGAALARDAPATTLKAIYGSVMFVVAAVLIAEAAKVRVPPVAGGSDEPVAAPPPGSGATAGRRPAWRAHQWDEDGIRYIRATDGTIFTYRPRGERVTRLLTGTGALLAGLISTGVGEATMPSLVRRVQMPVAVAAATSTLVVASTVVGAAATHLVQLAAEGGLSAIPWNLVVWAVPGAVVGAQIGARLQGVFDERRTNYFFGVLFVAIGAAFLLSFTVFSSTFQTG